MFCMQVADEQQLIQRVKERDAGAFRVLVERYMKHAYNTAFSMVRNHEDAEDIAQEAFVRIYRSIDAFRGDSEFGTWLYRITVNASLDKIKQRKGKDEREVRNADHLADAMTSHATPAHDAVDVSGHIERALHELPTLQRAVVILRHINGLSTRQVGDILQCSEGTVKTHLHRGLKKMRTSLQYLQEE